MKINNALPPLEIRAPTVSQPSVAEKPGSSFAETLESAVESVNAAQKDAAEKAGGMALGTVSIDEAMITMEKADVTFKLMSQVRNKVVEAYRDVMRMNF